MDILDLFRSELAEGDIRFRDNLQFELKAEFSIHPGVKKNRYRQDFYIFIPATLQINANTYSREFFYLDQTNLIRYKTPEMILTDLVKENNLKSPLIRLQKILKRTVYDQSIILDELQLFGNIFKIALRDQIYPLLTKLEAKNGSHDLLKDTTDLCDNITQVRNTFLDIQRNYVEAYPESHFLRSHFAYTDEFLCDTIDYFLTSLLKIYKEHPFQGHEAAEKVLKDLILTEEQYQEDHFVEKNGNGNGRSHTAESILYRSSLLNKFMLEALQLNINRFSLHEKHAPYLGAIAAGVAMMAYMLLFAWKSPSFILNSSPFIFLAVILYVLKDRIKEGLKNYYARHAIHWFPDYSTEIKNRRGRTIGKINESFLFEDETKIPKEILDIRNTVFHDELPALKRYETIMHYKREVLLYDRPSAFDKRRRELTTIFRFNIFRFLQKASNPMQPNLILDKNTLDVIERLVPKVYHINIIIQNTYLRADLKPQSEIKKFRVVVDKFGIKRIEQIK